MIDLDKAAEAARAAHVGNSNLDFYVAWRDVPELSKGRWRNVASAVLAATAEPTTPRDGRIGGQRQGGMGTSREALHMALPKIGTQRDKVLQQFYRKEFSRPGWGLTDVELAEFLDLPGNSVRPRRVELVDAGWVCDTGQRRMHNGRRHVVWGLTDGAKATAGEARGQG